MKLFTKEILNAFSRQGYVGDKLPESIKVICKLFNPSGAGTWFLYEYNPEERIAYGYANLGDDNFAECGAISIDELEQFRGHFGLGIERDRHFPIGKHSLEHVVACHGRC